MPTARIRDVFFMAGLNVDFHASPIFGLTRIGAGLSGLARAVPREAGGETRAIGTLLP